MHFRSEREAYDRLATAWVEQVASSVVVNSCILAARAGLEALHYFGVEATAVPVEAVVYNAAAVEAWGAGIRVEDWPPEAHSVGAIRASSGDGYHGHVVLVGAETVADLTFAQFRRPTIDVTDTLVLDVSRVAPADDEGFCWVSRTDGLRLGYRPFKDRFYRETPDWRLGKAAAGKLIRAMRA